MMRQGIVVLVLLAAAPAARAGQGDKVTATILGDPTAKIARDANGKLRFASGRFGRLGPAAPEVVEFVRSRGNALGLRPDERLQVAEDVVDERGTRHVRVHRQLHGIPVLFDEVRLHADGVEVRVLEAELSSLSALAAVSPRLTADDAIAQARGGFTGELTQRPRPALVIMGGRGLGGEASLVYQVRIAYERDGGALPVVKDVFVDALEGGVVAELPRLYTEGTPTTMTSTDLRARQVTLNVTSYSNGVLLKDQVSIPSGGLIWTVDGSANYSAFMTPNTSTPFSDRQAVSVHDGLHQAIDYYSTMYGWKNWDFSKHPSVAGGMMYGIAHEGQNMANAYFTTGSGSSGVWGGVYYGDGDGRQFKQLVLCNDVTGHELGHGVVEGTAQLAYQNQSGALNEHFADVFAWLYDQEDDLIGEDCVLAAYGNALRDMCDPTDVTDPQPAHMRDYMHLENTEEQDWGGVHFNSGIPNRAACIARNAITAANVGKVWYQTLRYHMGVDSSFADMVQASLTSCGEVLAGNATACQSIASAWVQVGLGFAQSGGACPANATPSNGSCFCNEGYEVNAAGDGCDGGGSSTTCPPNSHAVGEDCYCNDGYVVDSTGKACVPESTATCSDAHSHRESSGCVCDECYQGSPDHGYPCTAIPSCVACNDPLMMSINGTCECIPGITRTCGAKSDSYDVTQDGTSYYGEYCCQASDPCNFGGDGWCDCFGECSWESADCGAEYHVGTPACRGIIPGDCGNETWAGRCWHDTLVFCNDRTAGQAPRIVYVDCSTVPDPENSGANLTCGVRPEYGDYDCVQASDPCQGVPATGECDGNTGRYCDGGLIKEVDCGINGCGSFEIDGVELEFCLPCPPNSSYDGDSCYCDSGYEPNADGDACVRKCGSNEHRSGDSCKCDDGYEKDGGSCEKKSGGCAAAFPEGLGGLALSLLALVRVARRRR